MHDERLRRACSCLCVRPLYGLTHLTWSLYACQLPVFFLRQHVVTSCPTRGQGFSFIESIPTFKLHALFSLYLAHFSRGPRKFDTGVCFSAMMVSGGGFGWATKGLVF